MTAGVFSVATYESADDLMQAAIKGLLESTDRFSASRGEGREVLGASFRLRDPRARLSRSEMRGKVYSALGEFFWCLSGSNDLKFIEHYLKDYGENSDDGQIVHGAYGPRIFGKQDQDQVRNVVNLLRRKRESRRAVVQIFSSRDLEKDYKDVPCTCSLQVFFRNGKVHLISHMRSNDAYLGLPHDIFVFTMLQELIARSLGADVGFYQHMVGHLHLYDDDRERADAYLREGFQQLESMPEMPSEDPMELLPRLIEAEKAVRTNPVSAYALPFPSYWEDILRLLRVHSENQHKLQGYRRRIAAIREQMQSTAYALYIPAQQEDTP